MIRSILYKNKIGIVLTIIFVGMSFIPQYVDAKESDQGVTLWPTLQLIAVQTGETQEINLHIKNTNDATLMVTPSYKNLQIHSNPLEGFSILEEKNAEPASWLSSITKFPMRLRPKEEKVFKSKISIPQGVENNGYYAIILLHFAPKDKNTQLFTTSEIGSALYITVGNVLGEEIHPDAQIKTFSVKPKINFNTKIHITTSVSNTGNIHYRPRGKVTIINPKGVIQSDTPSFNEQLRYLLPGQTLNEDTSWKDNRSSLFPPIGKYRLVFDLYMEEDRSFMAREETYFYVIPFQYLFLLIIILILAGTFLKIRKKKK